KKFFIKFFIPRLIPFQNLFFIILRQICKKMSRLISEFWYQMDSFHMHLQNFFHIFWISQFINIREPFFDICKQLIWIGVYQILLIEPSRFLNIKSSSTLTDL